VPGVERPLREGPAEAAADTGDQEGASGHGLDSTSRRVKSTLCRF
jgi:hypothetical protein